MVNFFSGRLARPGDDANEVQVLGFMSYVWWQQEAGEDDRTHRGYLPSNFVVEWVEEIYRKAPQEAKFIALPTREEGYAIRSLESPGPVRRDDIFDDLVLLTFSGLSNSSLHTWSGQ
jgi:hypothetical protein